MSHRLNCNALVLVTLPWLNFRNKMPCSFQNMQTGIKEAGVMSADRPEIELLVSHITRILKKLLLIL